MNDPSVAPLKVCKGCGAGLQNTPEFFYRDRGRSDGLQAKCKPCKNGYFQNWLEPRREEVYEQNNQRNRERYADPDYRAKVLAYGKNYNRTLQGKAVNKATKARASACAWAAPGELTAQDILQMVEDQCGLCAYCEATLEEDWEIDHMLPLSRGGSNDWSNIAAVCESCNRRKHTRTVEEFLG